MTDARSGASAACQHVNIHSRAGYYNKTPPEILELQQRHRSQDWGKQKKIPEQGWPSSASLETQLICDTPRAPDFARRLPGQWIEITGWQ